MSTNITILVAEDSPITRKIIQRTLEGQGYAVSAVENGALALEQVLAQPDLDLLLTDWQMPIMEGVELIQRVRGLTGRRLPYMILLTSKSETEDRVLGLESGADDYLCKPFSPEELVARIKAGLRVMALQRRLDADLRQVGQLQLRLLPRQLPRLEGVAVAACYVPSTQASGDYYDFFPAPGGRQGFLVADVCDHGAPAAVFMAIIHAMLHSHDEPFDQPARVLANTNRHLLQYGEDGTFATALYGCYAPDTRSVCLANSGHPYPLHYQAATGEVHVLKMRVRPPLASMPFPPPEELTVQLQPGDRLLLYTDGITEVFNPQEQMYGEERLAEALRRPAANAEEIIHNLLADVRTFAAGRPNEDDQTMLALMAD